jgi:hypothetical protein
MARGRVERQDAKAAKIGKKREERINLICFSRLSCLGGLGVLAFTF